MEVKLTKIIVTLFLIFLTQTLAWAQETPPVTNFSPQDYKAHNQNWALAQSDDRTMYAANSDGLLAFNGANWRTYPFPDGQIVRTVLCENKAYRYNNPKLTQTQNRIYVGGFGEFGYWTKSNNGNLLYNSLSKNKDLASLATEEIWHIERTPEYIYFQSFSRIYRYDGHNILEIKAPGTIMFMRQVHQRLLVPIIGKGLYELKGQKFQPVVGTEQLSASIIATILPFDDQTLLICTNKNGLFLLKDGLLSPWTIAANGIFKQNLINKALILPNDRGIAIGTIQKGLYILDKQGQIKFHIHKSIGLQNNTVLAMTVDRHGDLWLGLDQGLDLIGLSSPLLTYMAKGNPLGTAYSAALWEGFLYVGTNNGVFKKKWPSTDTFSPVKGLEGQTWKLSVVKGALLCGHNDATYQITKSGIIKLSNVTGGWNLLLLEPRNQPALLLQGSYIGLHTYTYMGDKKWEYGKPIKNIPPIPIKYMARDKEGGLWISHAYKGLYYAKLNAQLDSAVVWKSITTDHGLPTLFNIEIQNIQDTIYIKSGNAFFTPGPSQTLIPSQRFAKAAQPFKIRPGTGDDWFTIFNNKVLLHRALKEPIPFDISLVGDYETIIPIDKKRYLFCLNEGFAFFEGQDSPSEGFNTLQTRITRITNLDSLNRHYPLDQKSTLPQWARSIRIGFALPVYGRNIQYQYRLLGLTDGWSDWSSLSMAEYTNLAAGEYRFEIRNNINHMVSRFDFEIAAHWYETVWGKLFFVALGFLLLLGLLWLQERRLQRNRIKLLLQKEKELEDQQKESERKFIELRNENLQKELKNKSQKLSNIAINVVRKNEILEEIRDELQEVKKDLGQQLPNLHYQKLLHSIERNVAGKEDWVLFEENFNEVHDEFFQRLRQRYPSISPSELRLAACLRMNLSTKEMAPALGISIRGVEIKRYRLRKKLALDPDINLVQYMMDI
ncbi:YXYXY domain-containing protein [Dyadobacter jejuensis]|uniref:YXYXY domain-containing protein n=1 Tax=Dyadobacter jejuensis TaxID=1082580 RepID=A0A316AS09_9BACT|nr:YXYXY domain-containing protein [Dyadobacter jejuensis]